MCNPLQAKVESICIAPPRARNFLIMQFEADYVCAYCGETNSTTVDVSAGSWQEYIEDCQVCCRPNLLHIELDPQTEEIAVHAEREND